MADRPIAGTDTHGKVDDGVKRQSSRTGVEPPVRGMNAAMDRWLQFYLRQLHQEVCNEPLPGDLSEMIERFQRRLQGTDEDEGKVATLSSSAQQSS